MYKKEIEGSISVFLALTITLMLSFCMVLIESARENTLLLKAKIIFDTGIQCLLAEYHQRLWEEYDLFYVDCSYGTEEPSYDLVKSHLGEFVKKNIEMDTRGWLGLDYEGAKITDVLLATDFEGKDFYIQAIEVAEDSVAIPYIEQLLGWFEKVEATYDIGEKLHEDRKEMTDEIENVNGTEVAVKEAVWGEDREGNLILLEEAEYEVVNIENPLEKILSGNILLRQIVSDVSDISGAAIEIDSLASHRKLAEGTVADFQDSNGLWNKALFCKYAMDHFACYLEEVNAGNGIKYELEYLVGGRSSDNQNMEVVVAELLAIREIDNYLSLMQDEVRMLEAHELAVAISAALVPWMEPVIYQALLLYWAYEDSVQDLQRLFQGEKIPIVKSLPIDVISEFLLGYEEYLLLLLLFQSPKNLAMRSIDIIELDLRRTQTLFRMDACISHAFLEGCFVDIYNKKYSTSRELEYY